MGDVMDRRSHYCDISRPRQFRNNHLQTTNRAAADRVFLIIRSDYHPFGIRCEWLAALDFDLAGLGINQICKFLSVTSGNHTPGCIGLQPGIPAPLNLIEWQKDIDLSWCL